PCAPIPYQKMVLIAIYKDLSIFVLLSLQETAQEFLHFRAILDAYSCSRYHNRGQVSMMSLGWRKEG
ncbi:MAG TPA: hypothetical protein PLP29_16770, partial [Candidatus Ozemobacteraceae bacterium]|nr:hypothetical protein [Candidatus Ozemobacteraceae bacterium]